MESFVESFKYYQKLRADFEAKSQEKMFLESLESEIEEMSNFGEVESLNTAMVSEEEDSKSEEEEIKGPFQMLNMDLETLPPLQPKFNERDKYDFKVFLQVCPDQNQIKRHCLEWVQLNKNAIKGERLTKTKVFNLIWGLSSNNPKSKKRRKYLMSLMNSDEVKIIDTILKILRK